MDIEKNAACGGAGGEGSACESEENGRIGQPGAGCQLAADRAQIAQFVEALFRHAAAGGFVALRAYGNADDQPPEIRPSAVLVPDRRWLVDAAVHMATVMANARPGYVFCPPVCAFNGPRKATEANIAEGLVLAVECDAKPLAARAQLETLLGPATVVVASGGEWKNPETGQPEPKLHVYWRLAQPTRIPEAHARLKRARQLATGLVAADRSGTPLVHPMRWPGSWHTKNPAAPRMAKIIAYQPQQEISLDDALAKLGEAGGEEAAGVNVRGARTSEFWEELARGIDQGTTGRVWAVTSVFGLLLAKGIEPRLAGELTHGFNLRCCRPPLPEAKVEETLIGIGKRELRKRAQKKGGV